MKSTKKMIMVPEMEYMTLLNMIKNKDEMGYEKSKIDTEISKTLSNPKLKSLIKGKKYDYLVKQQQQLRKIIAEEADRPKSVILDKDQLASIVSGISKYLGVEPTRIKQEKIVAKPRKISPLKIPKNEEEDDEEEEFESADETLRSPTTSSPKKKNYIIHPDYYDDMKKILKNNSTKLKINRIGQLLDEKNKVIEGSNYIDILHHLVGDKTDKPPGTELLLNRMKGEKYFEKAKEWAEEHRQKGEGKKLYKTTRGLIRKKQHKVKPFKPLIWAKL
jgi:hypothetical protein